MEIYNYIVSECQKYADPSRAPGMKAYMKDNFEFYGISATLRKEILQHLKKKFDLKSSEHLSPLISHLWKADQREMQYMAVDILTLNAALLNSSHMPMIEQLIITKSWWDTVDAIASNIVGNIFQKDKVCRDKYVYRWIESDHMWLQRSAMIFQLKYGLQTDTDLLFEAILKHDTSGEFFIRKSQGWALRQYSKYNPLLVKQFVEANPQLSQLTKKEALRLMEK
ncbi:MAG: DNA alkylation repair protein [Saprospiraceae bacterium]|nr:DNA alkylation repair protein [Saprospiraceae bacterium]